VAQELVALRYKDNTMNWEYSWIIVSGTPTNLLRCEFDLLFYNSQSPANWSRKNGQALSAVCGEISNTEI
jgi:hypothetical protein